MRICHIIEAAGGGSGQVVMDLAKAGVEAGDDVTVIYSPIRVWPRFVSILSTIPNLKLIPCPMKRDLGLHDVFATLRLYSCLRHAGPFDVIHSHSSKAGGLSRLAGLFLSGRQIYSPHGFITMMPEAARFYRWLEWILSFMCSRVIAVSSDEWRHAVGLGIPEKKLALVPNGISFKPGMPREQVREQLGFREEDYVIGFVGRLVEQKNPRRLIETFRLMAEQDDHARLAIVGQGPMKGEMENKLELYGLKDKAKFINHDDARDLMPGFDCLLCTSNAEAFGLNIVEALHAGLPVVSTPVGISENAVIDGKTGYVGDFTPQRLAACLQKLMVLDTSDRRRMSEDCQKEAQQFDLKTMFDKTTSVYCSLLEKKAA